MLTRSPRSRQFDTSHESNSRDVIASSGDASPVIPDISRYGPRGVRRAANSGATTQAVNSSAGSQ
jgi:hypothetical protein